MKTMTTLLAIAALISGVTIASAQNSSETRGPTNTRPNTDLKFRPYFGPVVGSVTTKIFCCG
jgi:hypothetical protein